MGWVLNDIELVVGNLPFCNLHTVQYVPQSFFQAFFTGISSNSKPIAAVHQGAHLWGTWRVQQDHTWHRCSNVLVDDILMILLLDDVAVTLFIKEPCLELAEHSRHTFGTIHFPEVVMC